MQKKQFKGQMTIVGLIMIMITLVVANAIMPTIVSTVNEMGNATNDTAARDIANLIPLLIVLAIIVGGILYYFQPQTQGYPQ